MARVVGPIDGDFSRYRRITAIRLARKYKTRTWNRSLCTAKPSSKSKPQTSSLSSQPRSGSILTPLFFGIVTMAYRFRLAGVGRCRSTRPRLLGRTPISSSRLFAFLSRPQWPSLLSHHRGNACRSQSLAFSYYEACCFHSSYVSLSAWWASRQIFIKYLCPTRGIVSAGQGL